MSVTVNGYAQHMISYYTVEDVLAGKLRQPSTIPELASLDISPDYRLKRNFRFPAMIEDGQDIVPRYRWDESNPETCFFYAPSPIRGPQTTHYPRRPGFPNTISYPMSVSPHFSICLLWSLIVRLLCIAHAVSFYCRAEAEEPASPQTPMSGMTMLPYPPPDVAYGTPSMPPVPLRVDSPSESQSRFMTVPMPIPMSLPPASYLPPGSASSPYHDHGGMPAVVRQGSGSMLSGQTAMCAMRPSCSSNRRHFDLYGNPASPRVGADMIDDLHQRRSQPPSPPEGYLTALTSAGGAPHPSSTPNTHHASYHYQLPSTVSGSVAEFYLPEGHGTSHPAPLHSPMAAPAYNPTATPSTGYPAAPGQSWQGNPLIPLNQPRDFWPAGHPPSTAGSWVSGPHPESGGAGGAWGPERAELAQVLPTQCPPAQVELR
jgi:hypothetical protein